MISSVTFLPASHHPLSSFEGLQAVLALDDLEPELGEGLAHLVAGRAGVIDDEHPASLHLGQDLLVQHLGRDAHVIGDDLRQHLLHVDDLDDLVDAPSGMRVMAVR